MKDIDKCDGPKNFFKFLWSTDFQCDLNFEYDFNKKNHLKYFFIEIDNSIKLKKIKKLKRLLIFKLDLIFSANRSRQFFNYWNLFSARYQDEIPQECHQLIKEKKDFISNYKMTSGHKINEIELLIDISPSTVVYSRVFFPIFYEYLKLNNHRNDLLGGLLSTTSVSVVLKALYGFALGEILEIDKIKMMKNTSFHCGALETYNFLCKFLNEKPKEIKVHNLRSEKIALLNLKNKLLAHDENSFAKKSKLRKHNYKNESMYEQVIFHLLNEDHDAVLDLIGNKIGASELDESSMVYLLTLLSKKSSLNAFQKVVELLMANSGYINNQFFLALILKRLLIRKKSFRDARSVSKLIRKDFSE